MEASFDPLDYTRDRYLWSSDGKTLIHDQIWDHISRSVRGGNVTETYSFHSVMTMWTAISPAKVLKRSATSTRSFKFPPTFSTNPLDYVKLNNKYDEVTLNNTNTLKFEKQ